MSDKVSQLSLVQLMGLLTEKLDQTIKQTTEEEKIISEQKKELEIQYQLMKESAERQSHKIKLNIGGQLFVTSKDTLLFEKDTFFYCMLSNDSLWKPEPETGEYFIDRDPQYFPLILSYLRKRKLNLDRIEESEMDEFIDEVDFYQIHSLLGVLRNEVDDEEGILTGGKYRRLSKIIKPSEFTKLKNLLSLTNRGLTLLYRAKDDGYASNVFHSKCDNKGATITIIKSTTGCVFGGYTNINWDTSGQYKFNNQTCLFSLFGPNNEPRFVKLENNGPHHSNQYSIYCDQSYGPAFGGGHDFYICNNCNTSNSSYSNLGHSFSVPGMNYSTDAIKSYLAGSYNFLVEDIEVFAIH
ncbi:hypothetical protein ABK040_009424 [Willaertia magna]